MTKTKSRLGTKLVIVGVLLAGGYWAVTNMAQHSTGRADDSVEKWATPRRMTKPQTAERPTHTVKFIVEALPSRALEVEAHAGTAQRFGPATVEAGKWSWTAHGVATGEFAALNVLEASSEPGAKRCWVLVDGKLYRAAGKDSPYMIARDERERCVAWVVVG